METEFQVVVEQNKILNEVKEDYKQLGIAYEHLLKKRESKLEEIKNACLKYCKAELLINERNLGRAEVADEILHLICDLPEGEKE